MKGHSPNNFPILRRSYKTEEDLASVINRSVSYVRLRLNNPDKYRFTDTEILLLCQDLRMDPVTVFYQYNKSGGINGQNRKQRSRR